MNISNEFSNRKLIKEGFEYLLKIEALLKSVDDRLAIATKKAA